MQHDHVLKKLNFDLLRGEGGCKQNICYHVAAFAIPFNFMQHDHVLQKVKFDLLTLGLGEGGGCGLNTCCHVTALVIAFNSICNKTMF